MAVHYKQRGVPALIAETSCMAGRYSLSAAGTRAFILDFAERFAYIRTQDLWNPSRFLGQVVSDPPVQVGIEDFKRSMLDDTNPARHYTAFVFVGYYLPNLLGVLALWLWEIAGFLRYAYWSQPDMRSGYIGLYHGRLIRRYGHTILPALMARDLGETGAWSRLSQSGHRVRWVDIVGEDIVGEDHVRDT